MARLCIVVSFLWALSDAFTVVPVSNSRQRTESLLCLPATASPAAADHHHPHPTEIHRRMGELTPPEDFVYHLMQDIHDGGYKFRVVVIGKGAILESTHPLGPKVSIAQSPSSGANLMTLASEDHSFEYHLQLSEVSKIVLATKETPKKTMRIIRLLNANGESMSSLILAEDSEAATKWYESLKEKHGSEIQL